MIDLSILNTYLEATKFKMEMSSIMAALRHGEWTTSIDLKDAYFHLLIANQAVKEVSLLCYRGQGLPVQGIALWTIDRSPSIH